MLGGNLMNYGSVLVRSKHKLIRGSIGLIGVALMLCMGSANAILISSLEDATNGGGFFAEVSIQDTTGGVSIVGTVDDDFIAQNTTLNQADILGLWFNVSDDSVLGALSAANIQNATPAVTGFNASAGAVGSLGGNNNLNGTGQLFDIGIALGMNGASNGAFQTVSFDFIGAGISEAIFANENVGMRVQSINSTAFVGGSSKLTGGNTTTPPNPVPTPGSLALLGIGALSLAGFGRRRRK